MQTKRRHAIAIGSLVEIMPSDDPHDPLTGLRLYVHSHIEDESIELLRPLRYTLTLDYSLIGEQVYGHAAWTENITPYWKGVGQGASPTFIEEQRLSIILSSDVVKARISGIQQK